MANEPEARIWATATDLAGTNQQRKRYFLAIEDRGTRKDVELIIGPGPAISVEPYLPWEYDYTVHDSCDHEDDYCVLEDPESEECQLAYLAQSFHLDKQQHSELAHPDAQSYQEGQEDDETNG